MEGKENEWKEAGRERSKTKWLMERKEKGEMKRTERGEMVREKRKEGNKD